MISLKDFKASTIFKNIENKLDNNEELTEEDIASLQLIVYTDFEESELDVLIKARLLIERISKVYDMDINDKKAINYLFEVLSVNMLDEKGTEKYEEETNMLLNPTDRYLLKKGRKEGREEGFEKAQEKFAKNLIDEGFPIEKIVKLTGLSEEDILNAK